MGIGKTGMIVGLLFAVSAASAQITTTSSMVGFRKIDKPAGFHISGMQFNAESNNTPETVYGDSLPSGSKIYTWDGVSGYSTSLYGPTWDADLQMLVTKWSVGLDLGNGQGYWVEGPSAIDTSLFGTVPKVNSITNSIVPGFQLCSYPFPIDRVVTNLGFAPTSGDKIYTYNGAIYETSLYGPIWDVEAQALVTKWSNEVLPIPVGSGFWYDSAVSAEWIVERPFALD